MVRLKFADEENMEAVARGIHVDCGYDIQEISSNTESQQSMYPGKSVGVIMNVYVQALMKGLNPDSDLCSGPLREAALHAAS